jgi:hypothetical protein
MGIKLDMKHIFSLIEPTLFLKIELQEKRYNKGQ